METGLRQICYAANESVLARVPMDVVDAPLEVFPIADRVLPKTRLPNSTPLLRLFREKTVRIRTVVFIMVFLLEKVKSVGHLFLAQQHDD